MREYRFHVKHGTTFLAGWLSRDPSVRIVAEHPPNPGGIPMELAVTAPTFDDAGRLIFDSLNACWQHECPEDVDHGYELRVTPPKLRAV